MALLTEIDEIERNSVLPLPDVSDPTFAAISDARRLRAKMRATIMIHAKALLAGTRYAIAGRPEDYPAPGAETNEAIGWAQRVLADLDGAVLSAAFRASIVNNPDVNTNSVPASLIRALGSSTDISIDEALREGFIPLLPLLAKGSHPSR